MLGDVILPDLEVISNQMKKFWIDYESPLSDILGVTDCLAIIGLKECNSLRKDVKQAFLLQFKEFKKEINDWNNKMFTLEHNMLCLPVTKKFGDEIKQFSNLLHGERGHTFMIGVQRCFLVRMSTLWDLFVVYLVVCLCCDYSHVYQV